MVTGSIGAVWTGGTTTTGGGAEGVSLGAGVLVAGGGGVSALVGGGAATTGGSAVVFWPAAGAAKASEAAAARRMVLACMRDLRSGSCTNGLPASPFPRPGCRVNAPSTVFAKQPVAPPSPAVRGKRSVHSAYRRQRLFSPGLSRGDRQAAELGQFFMAMYVYSTEGDPVGFVFETNIYD